MHIHALNRSTGGPFAQVVDSCNERNAFVIAKDKNIGPVGVVARLDIQKAAIHIAVIIKGPKQ